MNIHNCSLEIDGWRDEYEGFGEWQKTVVNSKSWEDRSPSHVH
jgi:hypothetical protein